MSYEVPSRLNTNAKLVQNKQLWRQSDISIPYHKSRFSSFRLHRIKLPSTPSLFLLVRGRSAQMIMRAFSIGLCIQYTIIDLLRSHSIQFISYCFHLICLRHCHILEIKFNILNTLNTSIDPVMCTESTHFGNSILVIPFSRI